MAATTHDYTKQSLEPIFDLMVKIAHNQPVHLPSESQIKMLMRGDPIEWFEYDMKMVFLHFDSPETAIKVWQKRHSVFSSLGMSLCFVPNKRDLFFSQIQPDIRSMLKLDEESLFSVTDDKTADTQTQIGIQLFQFSTSKKLKNVMDATAAVGGNTISFARGNLNVISNELDGGRFDLLNHNLEVLELEGDVKIFNDDFLDFFKGPLKKELKDVELIFFDPPWGGVDYKEKKLIELYLGDQDMASIIEKIFKEFPKVQVVMLKGPTNTNQSLLQEKFDNRMARVGFQKMDLWIIFRDPIVNIPTNLYTLPLVLTLWQFKSGKWSPVKNIPVENVRPTGRRPSRYIKRK